MAKDAIPASDDLRAQSIARSERFNSDPVGQYDALVVEVGASRAVEIWTRACEIYDREHADVAG